MKTDTTLLFTGASGFLGSNIRPILEENYHITTVGLTDKDDFQVDISKTIPQFDRAYDVVFHAAGKAHCIPKNEEEKRLLFDVNYQGTVNLCSGLERVGVPKSLIFISSVAVYGLEKGENITEEYPLNGTSPYALSKINAEEFLSGWCKQNGVILGVIRPSLIAGPNPPGNLRDMIKAIESGRYLSIGGGRARKSVLMVYDIAKIMPRLAEVGGIYNLCDGNHPSFRELEIAISTQLGKRTPLSIPYWLAKLLAMTGDCLGSKAPFNSLRLEKITESLTFSSKKAQKDFFWEPMDVVSCFKIR